MDIEEFLVDQVRGWGYDVLWDTTECVVRGLGRPEEDRCHGCVSELGCTKVFRLMLLVTVPMNNIPRSYSEIEGLKVRMRYLRDEIMFSETMEELNKVPMF